MRIIILVLCLCLISNSAYSQTETPTEPPPVFDKKFWTVVGTLISSSIILTEMSVRRNQNDRADNRLKIYTAHGISDLLIIVATANLKSDNKKWWWVPAIATSSVNGGFAVSYSKSF